MKPAGIIGVVVAVLVLAFFVAGPRVQIVGRCSFSNAERVFEVPGPIEFLEVVRRDADSGALLIVRGPVEETREGALRLDLATGAQTRDWVPHDATGRTRPYAGYTEFRSDDSSGVVDPLVHHGIVRAVYDGPTSAWADVGMSYSGKPSVWLDKRFTGKKRIVFGRQPLTEQSFFNVELSGEPLRHVRIEPGGDRIVCLCEDMSGSHLGVFSRARLARTEPAAAGLRPWASYDGQISDRGDDVDGDDAFDDLIVTPRLWVTKAGAYGVGITLRDDAGAIAYSGGSAHLQNGAGSVPVRFTAEDLKALGSPPYEIEFLEVRGGQWSTRLDQRRQLGRTVSPKIPALEDAVSVVGTPQLERLDEDADGRLDGLRITFELQTALVNGNLSVATILYDAHGRTVREWTGHSSIEGPRRTFVSDFRTSDIVAAGVSGPLTLKLDIRSRRDFLLDNLLVTPPFRPADFE